MPRLEVGDRRASTLIGLLLSLLNVLYLHRLTVDVDALNDEERLAVNHPQIAGQGNFFTGLKVHILELIFLAQAGEDIFTILGSNLDEQNPEVAIGHVDPFDSSDIALKLDRTLLLLLLLLLNCGQSRGLANRNFLIPSLETFHHKDLEIADADHPALGGNFIPLLNILAF